MNYRTDKYGNQISILGYGCMRFPTKGGRIDAAASEAQVVQAIGEGVNYFDTAYVYPGSESTLGNILEKNALREKVYIATKLPHYLIKSKAGLEKLFNEQLSRLKTDYVDYYLMHMLTDTDTWERLKALGIVEWLKEKQRSGAIRQVGFSYHGGSEMFCKLVDAYDWDFCQIQYNYMDEHSQAGRTGLQYAHTRGLPVIIMEPLRGGRLVNRLPEKAERIFAEYSLKYSPAGWAFRWLWDQKEVTCVLSGMNSSEMIEENIRTACQAQIGALGEGEQQLLQSVVAAINAEIKVGCTGCGYCMPCPKHVDIPGTFAAYNRRYTDGKFTAIKEYVMCTALRKDSTAASQCVGCGQCEKHCPQALPIRKHLSDAARELEGPLYKIVRKLNRRFKLFGG
ncbi:MAG: aldo/keto reductase [Clostridia bacterium]|nr:aldo/keto reductase [Clostridia bacterium]